QRAAAADRAGDHRRTTAGDRRDADGAGPAFAALGRSPGPAVRPAGRGRRASSRAQGGLGMPNPFVGALLSSALVMSGASAWAGQSPASESAPDIPISHHDRVYAAEQFSNTV